MSFSSFSSPPTFLTMASSWVSVASQTTHNRDQPMAVAITFPALTRMFEITWHFGGIPVLTHISSIGATPHGCICPTWDFPYRCPFPKAHFCFVFLVSCLACQLLVILKPQKSPEKENLPLKWRIEKKAKKEIGHSSLAINRVYEGKLNLGDTTRVAARQNRFLRPLGRCQRII